MNRQDAQVARGKRPFSMTRTAERPNTRTLFLMMARILIVEDDQSTRESLAKALIQDGFEVLSAASAAQALRLLERQGAELVLSDIRMPGIDGLELLQHVRAAQPDIPVLLVTAYASVDSAVEAMKRGAYDYLTKPINLDRLSLLIGKALEQRRLVRENRELKGQLRERYGLRNIVGRSARMRALFTTIEQVAAGDATVLITGESGTGKELVARAIHAESKRADGPFVAVSCAALPENLQESELFGHERGAFTGAHQRKRGRFELAHRGTLFLDEIGDISLPTQAKLLRVLQERAFERVGGTETIKVDVRLIAATNKDLRELMDRGQFREDLYYRLNVVPLAVPPLRERVEDIPVLGTHFLARLNQESAQKVRGITPQALRLLCAYPWPGNVRELANCLESMVALAKSDEWLTERDLPPNVAGSDPSRARLDFPVGVRLDEIEKQTILRTLEAFHGNKRRTAEVLGIGLKTLYRKLEEFGQASGQGSEVGGQGSE
jgi:DNA-binding NtrC family response regulator